jgi:hypothetical protein
LQRQTAQKHRENKRRTHLVADARSLEADSKNLCAFFATANCVPIRGRVLGRSGRCCQGKAGTKQISYRVLDDFMKGNGCALAALCARECLAAETND